MNKYFILFVTILFSLNSLSQYTIKLIDGTSIKASSVKYERKSSICKIDETKEITKEQILCIIPSNKNSYTFHHKKNRKLKLSRKIINNNYKDTDLAKVYAFKYYKSKLSPEKIYAMSPEINVSKDEFISDFKNQHKKIKNASVVSIVLSAVAFTLGLSVLLGTLNDLDTANDYSSNNIPLYEYPYTSPPQYLLFKQIGGKLIA